MGQVNISSEVNVKNYGDLIDLCNDLSHFVDDDNSKLSNEQYNRLVEISDKFNEWKPELEVTSKWSGKEAEL